MVHLSQVTQEPERQRIGMKLWAQNPNEKGQACMSNLVSTKHSVSVPFVFSLNEGNPSVKHFSLSSSSESSCMMSPWEHAHSLCRLENFHCFKGSLMLDFNLSKRLPSGSMTPKATYFSFLLVMLSIMKDKVILFPCSLLSVYKPRTNFQNVLQAVKVHTHYSWFFLQSSQFMTSSCSSAWEAEVGDWSLLVTL